MAEAARKPRMSLKEYIRTLFVGPVLMRAERARRDLPDSRKLVPVNPDELDALEGIDSSSIRFPVAAFAPKMAVTYPCYLHQRGGIVEVIPQNFRTMSNSEWIINPIKVPDGLTFTRDDRGYYAAHLEATGQLVLLHRNIEPPTSGNDWKPEDMWMLPTKTRTYWIAGNHDDLVRITPREENVIARRLDEETTSDIKQAAYAPQRRILGRFLTFAEVFGDPISTVKEFDSFTLAEINRASIEMEIWTDKVVIPELHPDVIEPRKDISAETREKVRVICNETRGGILDLSNWFKWWLPQALKAWRQKKASGLPASAPKLPNPIGREPRKGAPLMLQAPTRERLTKILWKPAAKPKPKATPKPKPAATPSTEAPADTATLTETAPSAVDKFNKKAAAAKEPKAPKPVPAEPVASVGPEVTNGLAEALKKAGFSPSSAEEAAQAEETLSPGVADTLRLAREAEEARQRRSNAAKKAAATRKRNKETTASADADAATN
jgi:hypothetical protein